MKKNKKVLITMSIVISASFVTLVLFNIEKINLFEWNKSDVNTNGSIFYQSPIIRDSSNINIDYSNKPRIDYQQQIGINELEKGEFKQTYSLLTSNFTATSSFNIHCKNSIYKQDSFKMLEKSFSTIVNNIDIKDGQYLVFRISFLTKFKSEEGDCIFSVN